MKLSAEPALNHAICSALNVCATGNETFLPSGFVTVSVNCVGRGWGAGSA